MHSTPPNDAIREIPTPEDWKPVHSAIVELSRKRASHERELCWWLKHASRLRVPQACGFASLYEYADRYIGLNRRQTEERLRVGRCLEHLPVVDEALEQGEVPWSKVRELTRIATADTERDWLTWSQARTCREVEHAVATRRRGDRPSDPGDPSRQKHRLSFEVTAETIAAFRALEQQVRQDLGTHQVDDDTVLLEIARRGLQGSEEGVANYQIAVTLCDACKSARIDAAGGHHEVAPEVAAMSQCDAQVVGTVTTDPHVGAFRRAKQTIPPRIRRLVIRRSGSRCAVPGCNNNCFLDVHHVIPKHDGGNSDPELLVPLCGAHHRMTHRCTLVIEGTASEGFRFYHADGSPYGNAVNPGELDAAAKVAIQLVGMGMTLRRANELVGQARELCSPRPDDAEALLEASLQLSRQPDFEPPSEP